MPWTTSLKYAPLNSSIFTLALVDSVPFALAHIKRQYPCICRDYIRTTPVQVVLSHHSYDTCRRIPILTGQSNSGYITRVGASSSYMIQQREVLFTFESLDMTCCLDIQQPTMPDHMSCLFTARFCISHLFFFGQDSFTILT